jgi:hypothetical protein
MLLGYIAGIFKIERYRNVREEGEETEMIQERRLKKKLFRTLGPGEDELYSHRNTVRLTNERSFKKWRFLHIFC